MFHLYFRLFRFPNLSNYRFVLRNILKNLSFLIVRQKKAEVLGNNPPWKWPQQKIESIRRKITSITDFFSHWKTGWTDLWLKIPDIENIKIFVINFPRTAFFRIYLERRYFQWKEAVYWATIEPRISEWARKISELEFFLTFPVKRRSIKTFFDIREEANWSLMVRLLNL